MWKARLTYGLWLVGAALLYVFTDRYYALVLLLASVAGPLVCVLCNLCRRTGPAVSLHLGYPEFADEMNLLKDRHTANPLDSVRQVADKEALLKMQKEAVAVHMADSLYEYVTRLSRATREHAMITLGLSSRGALAVCRMAKAHAYMEGRDYAVPEDVAAIFADVSGHRVILSPKAKMTETSASSVIESVLASVPMPAAGRGE